MQLVRLGFSSSKSRHEIIPLRMSAIFVVVEMTSDSPMIPFTRDQTADFVPELSRFCQKNLKDIFFVQKFLAFARNQIKDNRFCPVILTKR